MATGRVPISDIDAESLASELRAHMVALHRMRRELERYHAWDAVAAACSELSKARTKINVFKG